MMCRRAAVMLLVIAAPAICLGGSPTANVLGRVEEFVKAGAAKDQQAFHELSMVCESRAAPFESKVRRAAEKLAGIDANIREIEAVGSFEIVGFSHLPACTSRRAENLQNPVPK